MAIGNSRQHRQILNTISKLEFGSF